MKLYFICSVFSYWSDNRLDCYCSASEEIARVQKQFQAEVARLEVSLKRAELRIQSQEQTIEQKVRVVVGCYCY